MKSTDGVTECEVDFPNKIATVVINEEEFDKDKALANLKEAGFPGTIQ